MYNDQEGFDSLPLPLMGKSLPKFLKCFKAYYSGWEELRSPVKNMKFVEAKIYVDQQRVNLRPSEDKASTEKRLKPEEGRTN